jgi:hypothetical protein
MIGPRSLELTSPFITFHRISAILDSAAFAPAPEKRDVPLDAPYL